MIKKWTFKKTLILVIITNLITAVAVTLLPIPFIGGKRLVGKYEYDFVKQFGQMPVVKELVEGNYVDNDKIDKDKMVEGAIKGMVDSIGDPYTVFMTKKEFDDLKITTQGSYAGVGIYVGEQDGKIVVIAPIEDSPAEKAGIKSGDFIVKVNGVDISAKEMDKAVTLMKGKAGTKVTITLERDSKTFDVEITRANITIKTVKGEMLENGIGYIRISTFDENTAKAFKEVLANLQNKGLKGFILDLRDNPGGLLDTSTEIADMLLGKGTIVYTIDNKGEKDIIESDEKKLGVPMAVLVNGGSASASEIVSGAIRDTKTGTLIGTKTFGKGLVQNIIPLLDGTGLKVTIARYYTPSGECIQGKGITPEIVIELPDNLRGKELTREEDTQLKKAIEVVKSKIGQ